MSNLSKTKFLLMARCLAESFFFPFLSLYLEYNKYITSEIGIIMSITPIVSLICAPLYSKICKNPQITKNLLCLFSILEGLFLVLLTLLV